jgi:hypothetical protein
MFVILELDRLSARTGRRALDSAVPLAISRRVSHCWDCSVVVRVEAMRTTRVKVPRTSRADRNAVYLIGH